MKRLILILYIFLAAQALSAQVVITGDFSSRMTRISMTVVDSLTVEPIAFASVYVKAKGDSVITNFTLTDHDGYASIKNIPYGQYTVTAELMGYKPWVKEIYLRDHEKDFGTIKLQEDSDFIEAAKVSDIATPITTVGDTLIFNASSYQIGVNDMLGDLLNRMPGVELGADGSVKMNGETVSAITVGGKIFFFDDPATAVKNLPAAIVDKIKVYDKDSKSARFTGVTDKEPKKVMDITVKKEYKNGWFGTLKGLAGASVGKKEQPEFLDTDSHVLYNANALVAAYTETDQVTVVGNAYNVPDNIGNVTFKMDGDVFTASTGKDGLTQAWQGGVNVNTEKLKGFKSTLSVNLKGADNDKRTTSSRTTYLDGVDFMQTEENTKNLNGAQTFSVEMEVDNINDKRLNLQFIPYLRLTRGTTDTYSTSKATSGESLLNSSESKLYSADRDISAGGRFIIGVKQLGDKDKRSVTLTLAPSITSGDDRSTNYSSTEYALFTDIKDLYYRSNTFGKGITGTLAYVEPFGEKWALRTSVESVISARKYTKNAFDKADNGEYTIPNDYYSSISDNAYQRHGASILMQYKIKGSLNIQAGFEGMFTKNETFSKSYGVESRTGVGEWLFDWAPSVNARYNVKGENHSGRVNLRYRGTSSQPSTQKMLPALDLSNPTRISTGNIYLKPSFAQRVTLSGNLSNVKKNTYLGGTVAFSTTSRAIVSASWYDDLGVLYSVPVNSLTPRLSLDAGVSGSVPLEPSKRLSLEGDVSYALSRMTSYQNTSPRAGMDIDAFDYGAFMADFWGSSKGDRFYSGASGFSPSITTTSNLYMNGGLKYRGEQLDLNGYFSAVNRSSRYSLDNRTNTSVWDFSAAGEVSYTTSFELELSTSLTYLFYRGYATGYGKSEFRWDVGISKSVGPFTFTINGYDLLNQTRNLTHTVSDNYMEDQYTNILGRYILAGVKWNFGKMSAKQSRRASRASLEMMF